MNLKLIHGGDDTMESNYLLLLDYCIGQIVKIKLTEEEKLHIDKYSDFEEFMRSELKEKYEFRTEDVCFMTTERLEERTYNI